MAYNNLLREYCAPQAKILRILIGDRPPIRRQKNKRLIPIFFCSLKLQIYQYFSISKYTNTFQFWAKYTNTFQKKAKYTNTKSLNPPP